MKGSNFGEESWVSVILRIKRVVAMVYYNLDYYVFGVCPAVVLD
jgi:hypothetical protein